MTLLPCGAVFGRAASPTAPHGIEAAANVYFDTHAKTLTLAQASLLAGLPQQPNVFDPINYLEGGALKGIELRNGWLAPDYRFPSGTPPPKIRQAAVLTQMVDEGYVTESQARAAAAEDLRFSSQVVPLNAPHFVFYVRKLLEERYGRDDLREAAVIAQEKLRTVEDFWPFAGFLFERREIEPAAWEKVMKDGAADNLAQARAALAEVPDWDKDASEKIAHFEAISRQGRKGLWPDWPGECAKP